MAGVSKLLKYEFVQQMRLEIYTVRDRRLWNNQDYLGHKITAVKQTDTTGLLRLRGKYGSFKKRNDFMNCMKRLGRRKN